MSDTAAPIDILKGIKQGPGCPEALLLLAPDNIRKQRACEMIKAQLFPDQSSASVTTLDAAQLDQRRLLAFKDDLSSIALFSPFRLFIVHNIDELSASLTENLLKILDSPMQSVCCVFLGAKLPASSLIVKHFKAKKALVTLEALSGAELTRWIQKEFKNNGIDGCPADAIQLLVQYGEESPDQIAQLIQHLSLFSESGKIETQDVRELFSPTQDASEFEFIDALMQKNDGRAESLLQIILNSGKSPFILISLLQRSFATYLNIAGLLKAGKSSSEIGTALKIQPWLLNKHLTVVRKLSISQLKRCIDSLLKADSKLKNRSLGTESIFSEFVYNVTHVA